MSRPVEKILTCIALVLMVYNLDAVIRIAEGSFASYPNSDIVNEPGRIVGGNDLLIETCGLNRSALVNNFIDRFTGCDVVATKVDSFMRIAGCELTSTRAYAGCAAYQNGSGMKVLNASDTRINVREYCFDTCLALRCMEFGLDYVTYPLC